MMALVIMLPVCFAERLNLVYDANGNLVTGDGLYREYNSLNQLWKVHNGSSAADPLLQVYTYHPVEERVLIKVDVRPGVNETTYYVNDNFVRVVNSSGSFDTVYVYHEGNLIAQKNPDGSKNFILSDHLGSSTVVTDEKGAVIENSSYSPYGELLAGGETSRYDYTGQEFDSVIGDYDYNARRYRSEWGVFTTPDGIIGRAFNPQNLNRYSYAMGNPYSYVDPTGHEVRVEYEYNEGLFERVVYINDMRVGKIIDGSERVETITFLASETPQGMGEVSFELYDYDVQIDPMIAVQHCVMTCSLNDLTYWDSQDVSRKENTKKGGYWAQAVLSVLGIGNKLLSKTLTAADSGSALANTAQGDYSGALNSLVNLNPISSVVLNSFLALTYQGEGRRIGERHPIEGAYRTRGGGIEYLSSSGIRRIGVGGDNIVYNIPSSATYHPGFID